MKNFILPFALTALLTFSEISFGAPRNYNAPTKCKKWFASWCTPPDSTRTGREVLLFRRTFQLSEKPGSFVINVSADNRFRLFVNGVSVAVGPARGDLEHWRYDTLDIGGHLKKGKNSIAAIVWNYASQAPIAQITFESGFVLDGATKAEEFVATPAGWKAKKSEAFSDAENRCAMYTGPGEKLDASKYDRGWTLPNFDDSAWPDAVKTRDALSPAGRDGENAGWSLIPREIPQLEETPARFSKIRKFSGSGKPADFINGEKFTLPANSECSIIIDNGILTNAYPRLITNRGAGSEIKVAYAEALYDERGLKGDRNSVEGRHFRPPMPSDIFLPDGGPFEFSTLWWRTWRYVRLDIKTANEPLDIEDFYGIFTGYPFREEGYFKSSDASAGKIWDTAWRTARLCALETYIDCPYYEQLQYAGDTRIQALISLYVSGDDRLMRKAIADFDWSRGSNGLVKSRHPSRIRQYIPPFALYWVQMLDDFARHRDDPEFVREHIDGARAVFRWYLRQIDPDTGMLFPQLPYWNFVDWSKAPEWNGGYAPETQTAASAINSLHLAYALKCGANLMRHMGMEKEAGEYAQKSREIAAAVRKRCYDESRGLFMNYAGAARSSQHANIMGILSGAAEPGERRALIGKILSDPALDQCTLYYRFYLAEAMRMAGEGDKYFSQLEPWKKMLDRGLTTFAEKPDPTRSDCHAWSSSPNYHLLSLVAGVTPAEYGFKSVRIEPKLGQLKFVEAAIPHPKGKIRISLKKKGEEIGGFVELPEGLSGTFADGKRDYPVKGGFNRIGRD